MRESDGTGRIGRRAVVAGGMAALMGLSWAEPAAAEELDVYLNRAAADFMTLARSGVAKKKMREKFAGLLQRYVDIRSISLTSLGPYQKQLTPEIKDEFLKLSEAYISAFFVYYIEEFQGVSLAVKSTSKQGKFTTVISNVMFSDGDAKPVRWRLMPTGSGYRIQDVNVRGVWLSISLKERYTDKMKRGRGDFAPLFEELRSAETW